ncbi:TPA: oligosaccharide flippase family protein [Citrobacter freundii]
MAFNNKIYNNAFWMISEKIISIFGLFFVTSFVAKYVGPSIFGQISLAMAIFQIVQVIAQMGGDNIIFKRVSRKELSGVLLLRASTWLRAGSYLIISALVVIYFHYFVGGLSVVYIYAVAIACFFATIDVALIYNNAMLMSKLNTMANLAGLIIGLAARYVIAYFKLDPAYLSIPIVLTTLLPFAIRVYLFRYKVLTQERFAAIKQIGFRKVKTYSYYMLLSGTGIVLSTISVALYTRINQFSLTFLSGTAAVGIFSVAATLATSWVFVSQALITSFYTRIYSEKDDAMALRLAAKLNRLVVVISLLFIAGVILFGKFVLLYLYGEEYVSGYIPMVILCSGGMLSSLGTVSYRFIVRHSGYYFLSKKMFILLLISIPLSYVFIYFGGLTGAALSTVLIELISLTVLNYFFNNGLILKLHKLSFLQYRW